MLQKLQKKIKKEKRKKKQRSLDCLRLRLVRTY